ncbi:MAG: protein-glutamate methylesterase [Rhodocyclaceae bacterium]|nr:protein-glutamate methylesterase [Rhodocyclaceae bacterium]
MANHLINVLVVDDSSVERELLLHIFLSDPEIRVIGVATDGVQAVEAACRLHPDVITMDVHMPKQDGVEATRQIMVRCPTPVIILSASSAYGPEGEKAFLALEAGALTLVRKPSGIGQPGNAAEIDNLLRSVKLMSEVKVVRRWVQPPPPKPAALPGIEGHRPVRVVAMGASAGGPMALQRILAGLAGHPTPPLAIVQHMTPGFVEGFAAWLQSSAKFPVRVAAPGEKIQPGRAYIAPDNRQMGIEADRIVLSQGPPEGGLRPSVSHLFRSVAQFYGEQAVGVLLTGMGRDGAAELKAMKDRGAVTIVQDEDSALVYGMPGEAVNLGGATHVLPLNYIPGFLLKLGSIKESLT